MDTQQYKAIAEGLLFVSGDEGMTQKQLAEVMEIEMETVQLVLDELKQDYEQDSRGITIMQSKAYYHLTTKPKHAAYYQRLIDSPHASRLSQAALETLAIVAYNQPITRTEIEEVRGVKSDGPVQTLLNRSLVEERGRKEGLGRAILYGTTTDFLTYFGLTSLEELPPLPEGQENEDVEDEADLFFESFQENVDSDKEPF
ncbi:SMC-Scp complex subunit ScpB [Pontibacillus yanchengensis]|uniref:Segregation and condensation protein B n=1 Tax=Pontibacillus yanchengensis Y32 TaxID=1385514 RepID=A0A0A2TSF8_9BACI|nr:SMC-Scp complex subunit ScpB [Pontibacillus yanchengensis]KGP72190.1 segregation and condensation protein B [Pontibacillus yanchengensis Y32]